MVKVRGRSPKAYETAISSKKLPVLLLDGNELGGGLCRNLGFCDEARRKYVRRAAEVARLAYEQGVWVIASLISPPKVYREDAHRIISESLFVESYLSTPPAICERRDPK